MCCEFVAEIEKPATAKRRSTAGWCVGDPRAMPLPIQQGGKIRAEQRTTLIRAASVRIQYKVLARERKQDVVTTLRRAVRNAFQQKGITTWMTPLQCQQICRQRQIACDK